MRRRRRRGGGEEEVERRRRRSEKRLGLRSSVREAIGRRWGAKKQHQEETGLI
jgi:hypothetical protein